MTKKGSYFPSGWSAQAKWLLAVSGRGEPSSSQRYFSQSWLLDPNLSAASSPTSASFPSIPSTAPSRCWCFVPNGSPQSKGHGLGGADLPGHVRKDLAGGNCKAASQWGLWTRLGRGAEGNVTTSPIHHSKCSADQSQRDNNTFWTKNINLYPEHFNK